MLLKDEGYRAVAAPDGISALELAAHGTTNPDLILADYNLPDGMDGLQVAAKLREQLYRQIPVIILTGDISTGALREIGLQNCLRLNKPVKLNELTQAIQRLLPEAHSAEQQTPSLDEDDASDPTAIFVVDDDTHIRDGIRALLEEDGRTVKTYSTGEAFLQAYRAGREGCLLVDAYLPGMNGIELAMYRWRFEQ
jgi:two-component system CheB/CheR fusion protein